MAEKILNARIINKNGTSAEWAKATTFVPMKGEIVIYSDLNKIKIGDGVSKVGELEFIYPEENCYIPVTTTQANGDYTVTSSYTYEQVRALVDDGKNVVVNIDDGESNYYASSVIDNGNYLLFSTYNAESQEMLILAWSEDAIQYLIDPILTEDHLSNDEPLSAGTAAPGASRLVSRADHVHPKEVSDEDRASWNAKLDEADLEAITKEEIEEMWSPPVALKFSSPEPFTLSVGNTTKNWDGTLEYSTDAKTWAEWDGTTTLNSENNKLYVRGTGNSKISGGYNRGWKLLGTTIACTGNIETLLDWQTIIRNEHPTMVDYCYDSMFSSCTSLTTAPELPATTLVNYCYNSMFSSCTSLTTAPELPATTLANYCYNAMFYGCTSLTTAPELPATTLVDSCYYCMFDSCTSLTTAPELPATTLANYCYNSMFSGCTSLTTAPELPATTLANYCYNSMFSSCTSLTTAPELPATTLATNCYKFMFYGCTSLTTAPELPATTLVDYCYDSMFSSCTSLTTAPELPATTLVNYCYNSMFSSCTSLTTAPELPATTLVDSCYYSMFSGCTSLTTAPELPATTLATNCYKFMFYCCTSLTTAPELPATTLANYCYNSMFSGCQKIKLSTIQTDEYTQTYRIPTSGTGTTVSKALSYMFSSTGGTFTGSPTINTTYYLHKDNSIVPAT